VSAVAEQAPEAIGNHVGHADRPKARVVEVAPGLADEAILGVSEQDRRVDLVVVRAAFLDVFDVEVAVRRRERVLQGWPPKPTSRR
jgi:hypothetical protein